MENFINFLIDWLFYSFIEGLIMYVYTLKFCDIKLPKLPKIIRNALIVSFGSATCSRFIPIMGLSQIVMILYFFLFFKIFVKIDNVKALLSVISIFIVCILTEMLLVFITGKCSFGIITLDLNSFLRILVFIFSKIFEIFVLHYIQKIFKGI